MAKKRNYTGSKNPNYKGGRSARLNISMSVQQKNRLQIIAKRENLTMSDVIVKALGEYDPAFAEVGQPIIWDPE